MRKALGILAVLGLVATPVMADLMPSGISPVSKSLTPTPGGHGTVGPYRPIYYTGYGTYMGIYGDSKIPANPSDLVTVTFAFHWPFQTAVYGLQLWSSLVYDHNEVSIVSVTPVGLFAGDNNYTGTAHLTGSTIITLTPDWQGPGFNPSSGTLQVGDVLGTGIPMWQNPQAGITTVSGSGFYPFMQVVMHVKNPILDSTPDVLIGSLAMLFWTQAGTTVWWTGGYIGSPSFGEDIIPEPASLSLLGVGVVAIGAGVWRRRR
jgi:hypothetical protein